MLGHDASTNDRSLAACRVEVLIARDAPRAVIFRRGPTKQVLLSTWDLRTDVITHGQWFKGRIYVEHSDLSPRGEYLVYHAAKHKGPIQSWTAISKPPFLSALVVFASRMGTCGGIFLDERQVLINGPGPIEPTTDSPEPDHFSASPLYGYTGAAPKIRDGWIQVQQGKHQRQPQILSRQNPRVTSLALERSLLEHFEFSINGRAPQNLGHIDWADWDHNGDLLFADRGALYRAKLDAKNELLNAPQLIEDLRPLTFKELPPTSEALRVTTRHRKH